VLLELPLGLIEGEALFLDAAIERIVSISCFLRWRRDFDQAIEGVVGVAGVIEFGAITSSIIDKGFFAVVEDGVERIDLIGIVVVGNSIVKRIVGIGVRDVARFLYQLIEVAVLEAIVACSNAVCERESEQIAGRVKLGELFFEHGVVDFRASVEWIVVEGHFAGISRKLSREDIAGEISFQDLVFPSLFVLAIESGDRLQKDWRVGIADF
jgi:hypothetical protein